MPTYDFICMSCGRRDQDRVLSIRHTKDDRPTCCGATMEQHFTVPPMVHWVDPIIEPFKHLAVKSDEVITSTRQNREFMKRHDLVDANDIKPPTHEESKEELKAINDSIKKITPDKQQSDILAKQGLLDITD